LSLIFWDDPNDPIRKIVIPTKKELSAYGQLDASNEKRYTVVPGCEHKYPDTALLLISNVCASLCRFCFRKRIFMEDNKEVNIKVSKGLEYITNHTEITNVLLTGGDPLMLSADRLRNIINKINKIEHVKIIRMGTKVPAFAPNKIIRDKNLIDVFSNSEKHIYIVTHFNHTREITEYAIRAINILKKAGVTVINQTPLLNGINADPETLSDLMNTLSYHGVIPYYIFINRPVKGNKMFSVPVERAHRIFKEAKKHCSGLAKKAKLVMSHASGKIEVIGIEGDYTYFKYHRHPDMRKMGHFFKRKRNHQAYWFDDYEEPIKE
jgi:KamA family protein